MRPGAFLTQVLHQADRFGSFAAVRQDQGIGSLLGQIGGFNPQQFLVNLPGGRPVLSRPLGILATLGNGCEAFMGQRQKRLFGNIIGVVRHDRLNVQERRLVRLFGSVQLAKP